MTLRTNDTRGEKDMEGQDVNDRSKYCIPSWVFFGLFVLQGLMAGFIIFITWADSKFFDFDGYNLLKYIYLSVLILTTWPVYRYLCSYKRFWKAKKNSNYYSRDLQRANVLVDEAVSDIRKLAPFPMVTIIATIAPMLQSFGVMQFTSTIRETLLGVITVTQAIEIWQLFINKKN